MRVVLLVFLTGCLGFGDDPVAPELACGDGVVDRDEQCDDGNRAAGDGCSATCRLEGGAQRVTLRQTTTDTILPNTSASCRNGTTGAAYQNSWMRRFVPADHAITTRFAIDELAFAVEEAVPGSGAPTVPLQLRVYSYAAATAGDTLDTAVMTQLATANVALPATSAQLVARPITAEVPAGGSFVVEVFVPDGTATGHKLRLGGNASGEIRPAYLGAPMCLFDVPTAIPRVVTDRVINLVINVSGTPQ